MHRPPGFRYCLRSVMRTQEVEMRDRMWTYDKLIIGTAFLALIGSGVIVLFAMHQPAARANAGPVQTRVVPTTTHHSGVPVPLELMVVTDAMTGRDGYPAFVPSNFTLPAYSTVRVRVVNYDDATALPKQYASVQGTVGDVETIQTLNPRYPNSSGSFTVVSGMRPDQVSHTFTIKALHLNVPIAPMAVTTFTIKTGK